MARPKKEHYVPQFLLRNFATGPKKNPKLWVLDKRTGCVRQSSVINAAHENQFYEYYNDEGTKVGLEDFMQQVDSIGSEIILRILAKASLTLSPRDRVRLSYVIACQMSRTPMIRNDMENLRQLIVHKWGPNIRASADDPRTVGEYGPESTKLSSLLFIQDVPQFAKLLQGKVWYLCEAPAVYPYVISDTPVTRYNMIYRKRRGNLGLTNDGIEIYLPLSTRFSIHIVCPKLAALACLSPVRGREYSEAIARGKPVIMQCENVEFENSLQVIWSERFVFAKQREHLDLALDMLRTNPELRDGQGVRQRPEDV